MREFSKYRRNLYTGFLHKGRYAVCRIIKKDMYRSTCPLPNLNLDFESLQNPFKKRASVQHRSVTARSYPT